MQEVEFRVLCANDGESCDLVKGVMSDFKISPAGETDGFDHKGVKMFESVAEAELRVDEIKRKAGKNVLNITLFIKR